MSADRTRKGLAMAVAGTLLAVGSTTAQVQPPREPPPGPPAGSEGGAKPLAPSPPAAAAKRVEAEPKAMTVGADPSPSAVRLKQMLDRAAASRASSAAAVAASGPASAPARSPGLPASAAPTRAVRG